VTFGLARILAEDPHLERRISMNRRSQTLSAATCALIASLAVGGVAEAKTLRGTVVHRSPKAHKFAVADRTGKLFSVHAGRTPAVGRSVTVSARRLRNGTFAAKRVVVGRRMTSTRIRGTVTFVDRGARAFVVSARGVSMVVHGRTSRARARVAAVGDGLPAVGTQVTVDATLDQRGEMQTQEIHEHGEDQGTIELEGIVIALDESTRTLTLSADDDGESSGTIAVNLPDGFDLAAFAVGDVVEIEATLNDDGTYTAVRSSHDDSVDEADGTDDDQGDDRGDDEGAPAAQVQSGLPPVGGARSGSGNHDDDDASAGNGDDSRQRDGGGSAGDRSTTSRR
jgi:hypothetical protein